MSLSCGELDDSLKEEINDLCVMQESDPIHIVDHVFCKNTASNTASSCNYDSELCILQEYSNPGQCELTYFDNNKQFDFNCIDYIGEPCDSWFNSPITTQNINQEWTHW